MTIEAMKQALEALESNPDAMVDCGDGHWDFKRDLAITALRAAIEQAEKQEPHSLLCVCGAEWDIYPDGKEVLASTAPRQWQGLTKKEFLAAVDGLEDLEDCWVAIEAKLKEKNT